MTRDEALKALASWAPSCYDDELDGWFSWSVTDGVLTIELGPDAIGDVVMHGFRLVPVEDE